MKYRLFNRVCKVAQNIQSTSTRSYQKGACNKWTRYAYTLRTLYIFKWSEFQLQLVVSRIYIQTITCSCVTVETSTKSGTLDRFHM